MPFTSITEFRATESPTPAEEALIAACQAGEPCTLGDGTLPPEGSPPPERHIRANLMRHLLIGGTSDCGPSRKMFMLCGAHIDGDLDLSSGPSYGQVFLLECRFDGEVFAPYASLELLSLKGSHVLGLDLQGSDIIGDLFLSEKFHSTQTVSVAGAKIGGPT